MKRCSGCGETKPEDAFPRNRSRPDGLNGWCRSCHSAASRTPGARERGRRNKMARRFGISPAEYDALLSQQEGVCASCGRPETALGNHGEVKALAVDHDHETGEVRALLCQACNIALGVLGEDPDRITALLVYAIKARDNTDTAKVPPVIGP